MTQTSKRVPELLGFIHPLRKKNIIYNLEKNKEEQKKVLRGKTDRHIQIYIIYIYS